MYHDRRKLGVLIIVSMICATLIARDILPRHCQSDLIAAIGKGDLAAAEKALAYGANPNGVTDASTLTMACPGQTATTFAVLEGSPQIVAALVKAGGQVNQADACGRTPLIAAIYTRNSKMCSTLLTLGADPYKAGADPYYSTVIDTPMGAVACVEQARELGRFGASGNQECKKEVQAMYQMLRIRGVLPTLAQASVVGDNSEVAALLAAESTRSKKHGSNAPERIADAQPLANRVHNGKGVDSMEPGEILRVDVGI